MTAMMKLLRGCVLLSCTTLPLLISGCKNTSSVSDATPAARPSEGPTVQTIDIGQCFAYRYSTNDRCNAANQLDCQKAMSDSDCGVPNNFVYTNAWCNQDKSTFYEYHVMCQGYLNTGPQPGPQCPNDHATGTWTQSGCDLGSCTDNCDAYCPGGYCTGSAYGLCYWGYAPRCDCGTVTCPCTGPDCDAKKQAPPKTGTP
ncbi:MAG TPA: hypothetical protein VFZ09_21255 [Archangium sp.]|uniref:hypothetical protein n=1 Tax=Archangium sp. TaxID=1872627 RepID=UPI002E35D1C2|nr:hypothetical protein [Archangium sp.]HEX5748783.1 hypothetical protein [Archangium sp.]